MELCVDDHLSVLLKCGTAWFGCVLVFCGYRTLLISSLESLESRTISVITLHELDCIQDDERDDLISKEC